MPNMPEHIREWVDALRSGNYKQCKEQLTDGAGFCCLGVLCEIRGVEIPHPNSGPNDDDPDLNGSAYNQIIPIVDEQYRSRVVVMNDEGCSFSEIADYIESQYA